MLFCKCQLCRWACDRYSNGKLPSENTLIEGKNTKTASLAELKRSNKRGYLLYWICYENNTNGIKTVSKIRLKCRKPLIYKAFFDFWNYSHSLTSSFPQLLFALFWANFREISLVLLRISLYSLCSQPVWYCFGIKVWYQFSEKSAEKNFVILFQ